jgi:hypothetical protein
MTVCVVQLARFIIRTILTEISGELLEQLTLNDTSGERQVEGHASRKERPAVKPRDIPGAKGVPQVCRTLRSRVR